MSVAKDPAFRDQYAGGIKTDPQLEALLSGVEPVPAQMQPAPMPLLGGGHYEFGPAVKLA